MITLITTTTVPALKPGATLEEVELQLQQAFLRYKTQSDGLDPTLHAANIVSRLDPSSGTSVPVNTEVLIYVKNLNVMPTPTLSPTPSPTPGPSPTPT